MSEMKTSAILSRLLAASKEIGNIKNPPFTAERFLVAIIDQLNTDDPASLDGEILAAGDVLKKNLGDLNAAKEALMAYICRENSAIFLDDLYMKKKLQEAAGVATQLGMAAVDAVTLATRIANDPSDAIKSVFAAGAAKETPKTADVLDIEDNELAANLEAKFAELFGDMDKKADETDALDILTGESPAPQKDPTQGAKDEMAALIADVKRIRTELQSTVYGQDNAINVFTTGYFQASMRSALDKPGNRPRATFLFAGPPGVGKTLLAEKAAEALRLPFRRFDMSEYSNDEANLEFCGADKVYKSAKAGNVTGFVADNPKCVLLFDEIEKAHISVIYLFLQMLDAGRLRDNYTDKVVSFSDAIIILTTNAGKQLYEESESGDLSTVSRKVIVRALQKDINPATGQPFFPGAICSRFASGNVVMFNHIGAHNLHAIAKKEIEKHAANLEKETGIRLSIDERIYTALLFSEGSSADARTIRGRAETFFNDELYELLRLIGSDKVKTDIHNIEKIQVGIDLRRAEPEIAELFASPEAPKVLLFAEEEMVALCARKAPDVEFIGVRDVKTAVETVKTQDINFILLDMRCGAVTAPREILNIEDIQSTGRDFFRIIREQRKDLPVYLLEQRDTVLDEEEQISLMRQGIRGVLCAGRGKDIFDTQLNAVALRLHQQASMMKLARENKLISFETAQTISKSGKSAQIQLFDFQMNVAVDSEDAKNILSSVSKPNVRFDDVIGARDAKKELTYFVEYLKNPRKYMGTGVKAPKGLILYGPPGTGKTMLAKAMACEAGVTYIAAEGNQFLKKYVGEGAEHVHTLFKTARKYAPSILFIDEIDAIGKERRGGAAANGEETLTAFLTEMDGFVNDPSKPVFVLAATNFDVQPGKDKSLDPALMRRFDRRVYIDLPNREDRVRFLKMKIAKNSALEISEKQVDNIAMRSTGMSLSELDSAVELALRSAIREGSTVVNDAILEEAFETFNGGEVKKWGAANLERVARHEAGHALLCWLSGETPSYLTIVARGRRGGYMRHADQEGKEILTKDDLLANIRTSLGGRASEIVYYGARDGISTGASGDLAAATSTAQQIVCTYGMDEDFGLAVVYGAAAEGEMSAEIRTAVNRILKEQMQEAIRLISENKEKIDALVNALMEKNYLNAEEIRQVLTGEAVAAAK